MGILLLVGGCSKDTRIPAKVNGDKKPLAVELGFTNADFLRIQSHGKNLSRLIGRDEEDNEVPAMGVTIEVAPEKVPTVLETLRSQLGKGYVIFRSEQAFGRGPDRVAVLRSSDQFDALRVMGTNEINYDIDTEKVLARIKEWDRAYGLRLDGAEFDSLEAEFKKQPADIVSFAQEVYKFCPDVVDQGTQTVKALAEEMKRENRVFLWWD